MTDTDGGRPYRLLDAMDGVEVPVGTSLLVTASEPAGTEFLFRLLRQGYATGEELLVLTTDDPAGAIADEFESLGGDAEGGATGGVRVIDCQTDAVSVDDESTVAQNVDTPRNLTDIGIGFKDAFDGFEAAGVERVRFGLLSLSVVLSYVDRETAYRFCQTLTRGLRREGALGLFVLNADAHDQRTISTLQRTFDGVLEVAGEGTSGTDATAVRVSGLDGVPDDWIPVE
jgi:KaiC/GvpD/RAD55 family RecA-like ATPase